jgi:hypothetical protein
MKTVILSVHHFIGVLGHPLGVSLRRSDSIPVREIFGLPHTSGMRSLSEARYLLGIWAGKYRDIMGFIADV